MQRLLFLALLGAGLPAQVMQQALVSIAAPVSGGGGSAPVISTSALNSNSTNCNSGATCALTINSLTPPYAIVAHAQASLSGSTTASFADSSSGGGTPDTFAQVSTCGAGTYAATLGEICTFYVCSTSVAAGNVTFTVTWGASATFRRLDVEIITGMKTSACLDTSGLTAGTTSTNPTATTAGNIAGSNELLTAFTIDSVAVTTGSGFTTIQSTGGFGAEKANSSPASGAKASANWTAGSGLWTAEVAAWLHP